MCTGTGINQEFIVLSLLSPFKSDFGKLAVTSVRHMGTYKALEELPLLAAAKADCTILFHGLLSRVFLPPDSYT